MSKTNGESKCSIITKSANDVESKVTIYILDRGKLIEKKKDCYATPVASIGYMSDQTKQIRNNKFDAIKKTPSIYNLKDVKCMKGFSNQATQNMGHTVKMLNSGMKQCDDDDTTVVSHTVLNHSGNKMIELMKSINTYDNHSINLKETTRSTETGDKIEHNRNTMNENNFKELNSRNVKSTKKLIFTSENAQIKESTLPISNLNENVEIDEMSTCSDMGSLFEVSVNQDSVLSQFNLPTSTMQACGDSIQELEFVASNQAVETSNMCDANVNTNTVVLTKTLNEEQCMGFDCIPIQDPVVTVSSTDCKEEISNFYSSSKTTVKVPDCTATLSNINSLPNNCTTIKKPVQHVIKNHSSGNMKIIVIQGKHYLQHNEKRTSVYHSKPQLMSQQALPKIVDTNQSQKMSENSNILKSPPSDESLSTEYNSDEVTTPGWECPSGHFDSIEGTEEVVVLTPFTSGLVMTPSSSVVSSDQGSEFKSESCNSQSLSLDNLKKFALTNVSAEQAAIDKKLKMKLAKQAQRTDPHYRARENELLKQRMRQKRMNPEYRKNEREKDRIRRAKARKENQQLRERERERDRTYYYYKKMQQNMDAIEIPVDMEEEVSCDITEDIVPL